MALKVQQVGKSPLRLSRKTKRVAKKQCSRKRRRLAKRNPEAVPKQNYYAGWWW